MPDLNEQIKKVRLSLYKSLNKINRRKRKRKMQCNEAPFTAKFFASRYTFRKRLRDFGFFCSVNHLSRTGVNANHNVRTRSPSLARRNETQNGEGNRDSERNFCRRKEEDIALFFQVTTIIKCRKMFEGN